MNDAGGKRFGRGQVALALPLAGLLVFWVFVVLAQFSSLYVTYGANYDNYSAQQNQFHLDIYLVLAGLTALGFAAVTARKLSQGLTETRLARAVNGFALVAVFVVLIIATIYGFGTFMSNAFRGSFDGQGNPVAPNLTVRVLNVYLPILLDAALMVFVILKAFVGRATADETTEGESANG